MNLLKKELLRNRNQKVKIVDTRKEIEILYIFPEEEDIIPEFIGVSIMPLPEFYWYVYKKREVRLRMHPLLVEKIKK
jgi:hypothetical protein